jgi:NDP-sugar pyrophosphorylase family protein
VQFSSIGDGVTMGPGNIVLTSVIGAETNLVTREWISLCVVGPGCFFAPRFIQFATVGRDAQVYPSMYYDFRLDGKPILTPFRGRLVDAGTEFLGPIIGHRAKVAGGLALGPGRMVPNGVTVYPNEATVVNRFPPGLEEGDVVFAGAQAPISASKKTASTTVGGARPRSEPKR